MYTSVDLEARCLAVGSALSGGGHYFCVGEPLRAGGHCATQAASARWTAHQDPGQTSRHPESGRPGGYFEICAIFPFQLLTPRTDSAAGCASLLTIPLRRFYGDVSSLESSIFYDFKGNLIAATAGTGQVSFKSFSD